jgi:hypothetical protein
MGERTFENAKITELTSERDAARDALEAKRVQYIALLSSYQILRSACLCKDSLMQLVLSVIDEGKSYPRWIRWATFAGTLATVESIINLEWSNGPKRPA